MFAKIESMFFVLKFYVNVVKHSAYVCFPMNE